MPPEPRILYVGYNPLSYTPAQLEDLRGLSIMGMNVMILRYPGDAHFASHIAQIRAHPILSRFKMMYQAPSANWALCNPNSCNSKPTYAQLHAAMNTYVTVALQNSDIIAGYYTHDEPALYRTPKEFQIAVYNYIRSRDPQRALRPVAIAHTHPRFATNGSMSDAETAFYISSYMSPLAQDLVMPDEYTHSQQAQTTWMNWLNQYGFLEKDVVPVLAAQRGVGGVCDYNDVIGLSNFVRTALTNLGKLHRLKGYGYFAYWPGDKVTHGFEWAMDNCIPLKVSTAQHLTYARANIDSRLNPANSIFRNNLGQTLVFDNSENPERGFAHSASSMTLSGGGRFDSATKLHPPFAPYTFIEMSSNVLSVPSDRLQYLTARVGLDANAECGGGVRMTTEIYNLTSGQRQTTEDFFLSRNSGPRRLFTDLSPYRGNTIRAYIRVYSGGDAHCDHALISKLHLHEVPLIDFRLENHAGAWFNHYGEHRPVNSSLNPERGWVSSPVIRNISGGGQTTNATLIHPPYSGSSTMNGYFGVHWNNWNLRSYYSGQFSLSANAECGDGVQFEAIVWEPSSQTGASVQTITLDRLSGRKTIFGDLGNFNGRRVENILRIRSRSNANCDHSLMENFRILHLPPLSD